MGCFMELGAIEFANNNLNLSADAFFYLLSGRK